MLGGDNDVLRLINGVIRVRLLSCDWKRCALLPQLEISYEISSFLIRNFPVPRQIVRPVTRKSTLNDQSAELMKELQMPERDIAAIKKLIGQLVPLQCE